MFIFRFCNQGIPSCKLCNILLYMAGPGPPHCSGFVIALRHTTFGTNPTQE